MRALQYSPRSGWIELVKISDPYERELAARRIAEAAEKVKLQGLRDARAALVEKERLEAIEREKSLKVKQLQQKNDESLKTLFPDILNDRGKDYERALIKSAFLPPMQAHMHQVDCILIADHLLQQSKQERDHGIVDQLLQPASGGPGS